MENKIFESNELAQAIYDAYVKAEEWMNQQVQYITKDIRICVTTDNCGCNDWELRITPYSSPSKIKTIHVYLKRNVCNTKDTRIVTSSFAGEYDKFNYLFDVEDGCWTSQYGNGFNESQYGFDGMRGVIDNWESIKKTILTTINEYGIEKYQGFVA